MAVKSVIILLTLIASGTLAEVVQIPELEEINFRQRIIHPAVTAESETDSSPFVPDSVKLPLPPRTVNLKCRCGVHECPKTSANVVRGPEEFPSAENQSMPIMTVENMHRKSKGSQNVEMHDEVKADHELDNNVGGDTVPTDINEFPWVVALIYRHENGSGEHFCGGTLISSKFILTATHCFIGKTAAKTEVWLNERNFLLSTETPHPTLKVKVARLIPHPNYNPLMYYNDISLLELSESIDVTQKHLRPICLPPHENYDALENINTGDKLGITAGWGRTSFEGPKSDQLLHVKVPLITNKDCTEKSESWYRDRVTDYMMCAGDLVNGGPDSCPGDSGGPLFVELPEKQYQLVGIVSWGDRCAEARKPGVYTNVAKYIKWIDSVEGGKDVKETNYRCAM